jgi:hypothetical protein
LTHCRALPRIGDKRSAALFNIIGNERLELWSASSVQPFVNPTKLKQFTRSLALGR